MAGTRTLTVGVAVAGLLLVAIGPAAAAPEPSMTVDLESDGSADVVVTSTFDLDSDEEQAAFDELGSNESAREAYAVRFRERLQTVAETAAAGTGRDMAVTDASITLDREGSTGVVTATATWDGLAAVDGDRLTLSAPFASEFTTDRRFVVILPDGYELDTTTPEPSSTADGRVVYEAGTSLDGFELVAGSSDATAADENGDSTGGDATSGSGPGFGVTTVVAALAGAGVLARRL